MASLWNPLITTISISPSYLLNSHLRGNYTGSKESTLPYLDILEGLGVKLFHILLQQRKKLPGSLWRPVWHFVLHPLSPSFTLLVNYISAPSTRWFFLRQCFGSSFKLSEISKLCRRIKSPKFWFTCPSGPGAVGTLMELSRRRLRMVFPKDIPFPVDLIWCFGASWDWPQWH